MIIFPPNCKITLFLCNGLEDAATGAQFSSLEVLQEFFSMLERFSLSSLALLQELFSLFVLQVFSSGNSSQKIGNTEPAWKYEMMKAKLGMQSHEEL